MVLEVISRDMWGTNAIAWKRKYKVGKTSCPLD